MLLLILLTNILLIYLYFFRDSFIAELAISFVPYIIAFLWIIILILVFLLLKYSNQKHKNKLTYLILSIILLIISIWIEMMYSSEYFWFYNQPDDSIRLTDEEGIKVLYANILYKNTDYKSLQEKIEKENPDIVILVEFSDNHEDEMKSFFKENYPYMNRNSWSNTLAGDVVFSKIPLQNITETHLVEAWARNYSYMKLQCEKCWSWVDLYVIHTAAPVSYKNYEMRNNQIGKLLSDFLKQQNTGTPTMIIWDFNLSPWSYYYKQLTRHRNMLNALSYQFPNYTRSLHKKLIFRSHIDQLFISPEIKVSEVNIEKLIWSDHRSFTFRFESVNN